MNWAVILENILIILDIVSIIITLIYSILFFKQLRNPKNSKKLVKDTPLYKYMNSIMVGFLFTLLFAVVILVLRWFFL